MVPQAPLPNFYRSMQFNLFLMQSCRAFTDPCTLCGSSQLGSISHVLNLFLCSLSQNCSFSQIWLLLYVTLRWLGVLPTSGDAALIPSELPCLVPICTRPVQIWTHPMPGQTSLWLDWTKLRLLESLLTFLSSLGSGAKTSSSCSGSSPRSTSEHRLKLWL